MPLDSFLKLEQSDWSEEILDDLINKKLHNRQEWKQVEFKGGDNVNETVASFTYSNDGLILVGIDNAGNKIGTSKGRKEISQSIASCLNPTPGDYDVFEVKLANNRNICIIRVMKSDDPSRFKQQFYRRVGEQDIPLSDGESRDLIMQIRATNDYSNKPMRRVIYPDELDEKRLGKYLQLTKEERHKDISATEEDFLKMNCQAVCSINGKEVFTAAGTLLFTKQPQVFIPHSKITCLKYQGSDVTSTILDRVDCEGNLIEIIESAFSFIQRNIPKMGIIEGTRTNYYFEYPEISFREAIINAVSHRDYYIENLDVQIFIFNNRIEIISPGNFPKDSLINDIPIRHCPRNRLIAQLLQDCGYGDRTGSGVTKIIKSMEDLKRKKPEFKDADQRAKVTLWGRLSIIDDLERSFKLDSNQKKAIDIAIVQGYIQTGQYSAVISCSRVIARTELENLAKLRLLTKKGKGRATKYVLADNVK